MGDVFLQLGDVELAGSDGFSWDFTLGASAPEMRLLVTSAVDQKLGVLPPVVPLTMRQFRSGSSGGAIDELKVSQAVLLRRDRAPSPDLVSWIVTDTRYYLQDLMVSSLFNLSRPGNQRADLAPGVLGEHTRVPIAYWKPLTIKKKDTSEFASLLDRKGGRLEAWTALEAVKYMATTYFKDRKRKVIVPGLGEFIPSVDFSSVKENGVPLVNIPSESTWPVLMNQLMALARVSFFVVEGGTYLFRTLEPQALPTRVGGYDEAGTVIWQDRARERSAAPAVLFPTRYELRLHYVEPAGITSDAAPTASRTDDLDVQDLIDNNIENVVQLPDDVTTPSGEVLKAGTDHEVTKVLDAWEHDTVKPYPGRGSVAPLSLDVLREVGLGSTLEARYALGKGARNDPIWEARLAALRRDWRRRFRVLPELMSAFDDLRAERVAIVGPRGEVGPSPVWCDYTRVYDEIRYQARGSATKTKSGENTAQGSRLSPRGWSESARGVRDLPIDDIPASDFMVRIVDPAQGVFTVDTLHDMNKLTHRLYLGHLKNIPNGVVGVVTRANVKATTELQLKRLFRLSTIASVTPITPNNNGRLHHIDGKDVFAIPTGAKGPPAEIMARELVAGFSYRDQLKSRFEVDSSTGQVVFSGYELANASIVRDVAKAKVRDYYFGKQDRQVGEFRAPGFDRDIDQPNGSVEQVSVRFGEDGALEAYYVSERPLAEPNLVEDMDPRSKRVILRLANIQG